MPLSFLKLLTVFVIVFTCALQAFADGAYRWKDASGQVFYGTKPPKKALNVEKIEGASFSRYSGSKVLNAYSGIRSNSTKVSESDLALSSDDLPVKKPPTPSATDRAKLSETNVSSLDDSLVAPAKLTAGKLEVQHNEKKQITQCQLRVKNLGDDSAHEVVVAFHFEDGTLIPAIGPDILSGKDEKVYSIAKEQLPITIKTVASAGAKPVPKAVIDYAEQNSL